MPTPPEILEQYGDEYPAALVLAGVRVPLIRETQFSRIYECAERRLVFRISRFMDGSATMSFAQLREFWPQWTNRERSGFAHEFKHLYKQADYLEMLRFVLGHGDTDVWSATALSSATHLPQEEAFDFLVGILPQFPLGEAGNITQAIAATRHPSAPGVLREQLQVRLSHADLWQDDDFLNWIAVEAIALMGDLIELGAEPAEFETQARARCWIIRVQAIATPSMCI